MSQTTAALLGALAGCTVFIGLPVARLRGLKPTTQGFLNAIATGVLVFILWDILSHAGVPLNAALATMRKGSPSTFVLLAFIFGGDHGLSRFSLVGFTG